MAWANNDPVTGRKTRTRTKRSKVEREIERIMKQKNLTSDNAINRNYGD